MRGANADDHSLANSRPAASLPAGLQAAPHLSMPYLDAFSSSSNVSASYDIATAKGSVFTRPGSTYLHLNSDIEDLAGAPIAGQPDPSDFSAPALTIQQLEPAVRVPDDRSRFSTSGKYPSVDSLQAHPAEAPKAAAASYLPSLVSMAQLPKPAP